MKFLGIYPILGFEQHLLFLMALTANGASWTLALMTLNKLVIFSVIPTDMCRANIFMLMFKNYFASLIAGSLLELLVRISEYRGSFYIRF